MALRVLITGATGSIGSVILETLIRKGHEVTALVRDEEKGRRLVANNGSLCKFVVHELTTGSGPALQQLAKGFDCVIQASQTSHDVEKVAYSSFLSAGAETVASGSEFHFLYMSGCLVYGDCGDSPISESHSTANCLPIAQPRIAFEQEILGASREKFITTVLRPGCVYPESYIGDYIRKTKALGRVLVPSRDTYLCVIHSSDLADLVVRVVERKAGGVFNAAETEPLLGHQFAAAVASALGTAVQEVEEPMQHLQEVGFFMIGLNTSQRMECRAIAELEWRPRSLLAQLPSLLSRS